MNTRRSTRISQAPIKFSDIQLSMNKGTMHRGHIDAYKRHLIQQEVARAIQARKDNLQGYSGADGFVVSDQFVDQELSFDSDYDEESVKSDDELEEQVDDEDLDLESDTSDTEEEEESDDE